ncbi:MAG TPA: tRNA guanosine(34) transglycosylase Tgt [bacterium]|nr:tRNA guanosine(34) transglycosylase Tgt [bacterium]HPT29594.1 tRNA guanosine(34) transglycosylase Tgt [bacterium]
MFKVINHQHQIKARTGAISTAHGVLHTPAFMPDATRGLVKLLSKDEVLATGTKALVVNTFHLYLQPGMKIIKAAGGLHKFMNWDGPLLSDSGGFQVFSLIHKNPQMGKITDDEVIFKSPLDGSRHVLTPEKSIQIQFDLGVDMMVCLDDCPPNDFSRIQLEQAVERTINWAKRAKIEYEKQCQKRKLTGKKKPLIFSVIQGGAELDLRERCARGLVEIGFDGYGFGARPVDVQGKFLGQVLKFTANIIPADKIRFALGVGTPEDIKRCQKMGWDLFDCVIPTREGRHGRLFFKSKKSKGYEAVNINNSKYRTNWQPINAQSHLNLVKGHSRAYLHHLFKLGDPLASRIASLNNLEFYQSLMK